MAETAEQKRERIAAERGGTKPKNVTTKTTTGGLSDLAGGLGIVPFELTPEGQALLAGAAGAAAQAPRSGTFTRTYTSTTIPDDAALTERINKIFNQYYGRDAKQSEVSRWLPQLKSLYKDKSGASKTTVKETYKNGQLIDTSYQTAEGLDPTDWLNNQVKQQFLTPAMGNVDPLAIPEGPAGRYFVAVKDLAYNNGIMLSDSAARDYATKIVANVVSEDTVFNTIRESAASAFPQLADKIKAGIDVRTLANPYIQSMSNILEIPSTAIDVFDPKIRSAMSFTLPDGKVGTKSLFDFEKELRQDERWQYTNQARKEVADATLTVLRDFGFMG